MDFAAVVVRQSIGSVRMGVCILTYDAYSLLRVRESATDTIMPTDGADGTERATPGWVGHHWGISADVHHGSVLRWCSSLSRLVHNTFFCRQAAGCGCSALAPGCWYISYPLQRYCPALHCLVMCLSPRGMGRGAFLGYNASLQYVSSSPV